MNRRGFLSSILAAVLAPWAARAKAIPARFITRSVILNEAWMAGIEPEDGNYVAFIHPTCWRDIREYGARGRWEIAWHDYRVALSAQRCSPMSARDVLARFGPKNPGPDGVGPEIGFFESVRFIESAEIPQPDWSAILP